jgi:DNA-binding GntR family transcriptional regulator
MRRILEDLLDETSRALHFLELAPAIGRQLTEDHAAIAEALQGRDRDLARALLTVHLTRLRESVMASLRQKLRDENVLA